jgi:hypothetical protein
MRPEHEHDQGAIAVSTAQMTLTWKLCRGTVVRRRRSHDVKEPVYVAEALNRAAETEDEDGGAGNEALPPENVALSGPEGEGDRVVGLGECAGATLHWFFALSAIPLSGTLTPSSGIANVCDARSVQDRDRLAVHGGLADDPERSPRMDCRRPVAVSYW